MTDVSSGLTPKVAVLVDFRHSESLVAETTILPALSHWGLAHEVIDLATTNPLSRASKCGVILVAQEYMRESISPYLSELEKLVAAGCGWVSLDHALMDYPAVHREALGILGDVEESSIESLTITTEHLITSGTAGVGSVARFKLPLPSLRARAGTNTTLAVDQRGDPLLVTGSLGSGRIVQWLLSPKLWNAGYFGLAHGLDGLLWRGLVWACRGPLPMNAMPPFTRFRFDDCNGYWRTIEDLEFIDVLGERGHIPTICFCLRAVSESAANYLADRYRMGGVELAPHTLAPGTSIFFGDGEGEYDDDRFRQIFEELDDAEGRWGVEWSNILSDHDHEWSPRAIPYLRARGIRQKMNITLPGSRWSDPHVDWRPTPYGSMNYALSYLPGDLSDFYVVFNHHPSFESARAYIDERRYIYHRPGGFGEQKWDFLNGVIRGPEPGQKDLGAAAARIAEHTRIGLDSMFFGGSITHSHFTRYLDRQDWVGLIDDSEKRLAEWEQIPASYGYIATYAEARAGTHLVDVHTAGTSMSCVYEGRSDVPLRLSAFEDVEGRMVRHEYPVEPFENGSAVTFDLTDLE